MSAPLDRRRPRENRAQMIGGRRAVAEAIRAGRASAILAARGSRPAGLRDLLGEAERSRVAVRWVDRREIDALGLRDHQGIAAFVAEVRELDERQLGAVGFDGEALVVVLDGITDPQNFGACARAAEAAGAAMLVTRTRRAAPLSPAAMKASAGALAHLPVARVPNLRRAIDRLKDRGFFVVGLDHQATATIHSGPGAERPLVVVVGAEDRGMSRLVREACDLLLCIPMRGRTGSLNAAAALAVGLFAYADRPPG